MASTSVLIVEDEKIVAMDLQSRLEGLGFRVAGLCASGEDALANAAATMPDIVLMDIVLQGKIDGVMAASQIQKTLDIPVIFLTAYGDESTVVRATEASPFGYILKPFDEKELRIQIAVALHNHKMDRKLRESEQRYRLLAENANDLIWTMDLGMKFTYISPASWQMMGYTPDEMLALSPSDILTEKSLGTAMRAYEEEFAAEKARNEPVAISRMMLLDQRRKDGKIISTDVMFNAVRDGGGKVTGIMGITRDLSEREKIARQESELAQANARSRITGLLLSALPVFVGSTPPQAWNQLTANFSERFEKTTRTDFERLLSEKGMFHGNVPAGDRGKIIEIYLDWLHTLFTELGSEPTVRNEDGRIVINFRKCPWKTGTNPSPIFCHISRVIVTRSFQWTGLAGTVSQESAIAAGAVECLFKITVSGMNS